MSTEPETAKELADALVERLPIYDGGWAEHANVDVYHQELGTQVEIQFSNGKRFGMTIVGQWTGPIARAEP